MSVEQEIWVISTELAHYASTDLNKAEITKAYASLKRYYELGPQHFGAQARTHAEELKLKLAKFTSSNFRPNN